MQDTDFGHFLARYTSRVEPLSRKLHLAYWNATITGAESDYARFTDLDLRWQQIHADADEFEALRRWRDDGAGGDPVLSRSLDVLYRTYLRHQVDNELLEKSTRLSSEIVNRFNVFRAQVGETTLTSNEIRTILRESDDSTHRRAVWEGDKRVAQAVHESLLDLVRLRNEIARSLGFSNYYAMSLELAEQDQEELFSLFDRLARLTDEPFSEVKCGIDAGLARRFGVAEGELRPWHYDDPFFQEAPRTGETDFDRFYRGRDVVALVRTFFAGIGLDVDDVIARSDLYEKPGKEQHAYCMDIDRKGDIRVLANVRDDESWAGTMLHELGHAVYDRYISPDLPFVLREHAHVFVTEAIAMLFGRLSKDAGWIDAMLGIDPEERDGIDRDARHNQRVAQLVFARWCQVMVRFERTLYEDPEQDLSAAWWGLVQRYQGITPPDGRSAPDWAAKIHIVSAPVYYHNYMLGELLASQLDHVIHTRIGGGDGGRHLVGHREAGEYLRENVFAHGRRYRWDDVVRRATGEPLTPDHFVAQFVR